jgi:hypothetical protein
LGELPKDLEDRRCLGVHGMIGYHVLTRFRMKVTAGERFLRSLDAESCGQRLRPRTASSLLGASPDRRWRKWHGHLAHVPWRASTGKMPVPLCWPAERAPDATVNRQMRFLLFRSLKRTRVVSVRR